MNNDFYTVKIALMAILALAKVQGAPKPRFQSPHKNYATGPESENEIPRENIIKYLRSNCAHLAVAYNAQLAKIQANKNPLLNAELAAELEALPNPDSILEQINSCMTKL